MLSLIEKIYQKTLGDGPFKLKTIHLDRIMGTAGEEAEANG